MGGFFSIKRLPFMPWTIFHLASNKERRWDWWENRDVEKRQDLDRGGIGPTAHAIPIENVLRADEVRECLGRDVALRNAPSSFQGEFEVPAIIE